MAFSVRFIALYMLRFKKYDNKKRKIKSAELLNFQSNTIFIKIYIF